MSKPLFYWIRQLEPLRLAMMPRPRGGEWLEEEVIGWRSADINTVVSLLEEHEIRDLELLRERPLCIAAGIRYRAFPIADRHVPASTRDFHLLLDELREDLLRGRSVAIHCRAGIGRTGLVAGCLLHLLDFSYEKIFPLLSATRGVAVPDTPEQVAWVEQFVQLHGMSSLSSEL